MHDDGLLQSLELFEGKEWCLRGRGEFHSLVS